MIINVIVIMRSRDNGNNSEPSAWKKWHYIANVPLCNRWLQPHLTYFCFFSISSCPSLCHFPYPFLLSVLVSDSLSPGSGKNGRTKHRREQGSLGVWAGGFVGQPAGHTKRVRTRERERKQKGDAEPERCKSGPGYGCGCYRGSRERGEGWGGERGEH